MIKKIKYFAKGLPNPPACNILSIRISNILNKFGAIGIFNKISKVNPAYCR